MFSALRYGARLDGTTVTARGPSRTAEAIQQAKSAIAVFRRQAPTPTCGHDETRLSG